MEIIRAVILILAILTLCIISVYLDRIKKHKRKIKNRSKKYETKK